VVDYLSERVAVMCKGRLVEMGPTAAVVNDAQHPYTQALLAAVPEASLDHRLDFDHLSQTRASQPSAWPEPYRLDDSTEPVLVEVSPNHFVCAPGLASPPLKEAV
jgi:peptide/nickel transport system ATP-binding protein